MLKNLTGLELFEIETKGVFETKIIQGLSNDFLFKGDTFMPQAIMSTVRGIGENKKKLFVFEQNEQTEQWARNQLLNLETKVLIEIAETFYETQKQIFIDNNLQQENIENLQKEILVKAIEKKSLCTTALAFVSGYGLFKDYDFSQTQKFESNQKQLFLQKSNKRAFLLQNTLDGTFAACYGGKFYLCEQNKNEEFFVTTIAEDLAEQEWEIVIAEEDTLPIKWAVKQIGETKTVLTPDSDWDNIEVLVDLLDLEDIPTSKIGQKIIDYAPSLPLQTNLITKLVKKAASDNSINDPILGLYMYAHCVNGDLFSPHTQAGSHRITTWLSRSDKSKKNDMSMAFIEWPNVFEA